MKGGMEKIPNALRKVLEEDTTRESIHTNTCVTKITRKFGLWFELIIVITLNNSRLGKW